MFEMWQSFSDDALSVCPQIHEGESTECGAPVKKIFSKVGISFKGDGFYKNDHGAGKPNRPSESSGSSESSSGSDSGSSSKSDLSDSKSSSDSSGSSSSD
jgi:predicted nucleic acid-binding Zn ribbon protein